MEMLTGHSVAFLAGIVALVPVAALILLLGRRRRIKRRPARVGPWGGGPWDKFK